MQASTSSFVSEVSVEKSTPGVTAPVGRWRGSRWFGRFVALAVVIYLAVIGGLLLSGRSLLGGGKGKADQGPRVYALFHVARNPERVLEDKQHKYKLSKSEFESYQQTQLMLLKSRPVLNAVLRQNKVASLALVQAQKDPVEWLEENLQADFQLGPEILRVGMDRDKTDDLKVLVDAVTDAYLQEVVHKEDNRRMARLNRLQELYAKFDDILKTKQQTLTSVVKQFDGPRVESWQQQFTRDELADVTRELHRVRLAKIAAQARLNQQRAAKKNDEHPSVDVRKTIAEVDVLFEQEKLLKQAVKPLVNEMRQVSHTSLDVEAMKEEIAQAQEMTKRLSSQIEALKVELLAPSRIEKLQDATVRKAK